MQSALFTRDTVRLLIQFLPFPSIGRLAKSCKWMSANITKGQAENALKQAKERFGKVELVTGPSSGKQIFRLFSTNEDMIEIHRLREHSPVYIMKTVGRVFIGVSKSPKAYRFLTDHSIDDLSDVFECVESSIQANGPDTPVAWFSFAKCDNSRLAISFWLIKGGGVKVVFDEADA